MSTTHKLEPKAVARQRSVAAAPTRIRQASPEEAADLHHVFAAQRAAFGRSEAPTLRERKATLLKLQRLVEQNRLILVEAANADFGTRAAFETEMSEIVGMVSFLRYMRRNLRSWTTESPRSLQTAWPL